MLDLKMLAFDKGLGQKEVGEILGIAQSQVSAMMTGKRVIRLEHIAKLYDRFGKECVDSYIVKEMPTIPYQATATIIPRNVAEDIRREARKEVVSEVEQAEEVEIKETVILTPEILTQEGIDIKKELKAGTLEVEVKPTQDVLPSHHAKVYTETDEMSPEIEANDPVFVRFLSNKRDYIDGRMYFVDLDNASVVRWVVGVDADHIRLISMKDEKVVPFDRVRSISEVVAITKRPKTLPKERVTFDEAIARKDNQLDAMIEHQSKFLEQQSELIGIIKGQLK
jgi:predicted transcriptional regulator